LTGDGALLPAMPTSGPTPPPGLLAAAEAVGGGAVACQTVPWDLVDPIALVGLAARCDLRWLVSPADLPLPSAADLRDELAPLIADEEEAGREARSPALCALVPLAEAAAAAPESSPFDVPPTDPVSLATFDEIVVFLTEDDTKGDSNNFAARFAATIGPLRQQGAAATLPLFRVWLAGNNAVSLPDHAVPDRQHTHAVVTAAVAAGAAGLIVAPALVGPAKDAIRQVDDQVDDGGTAAALFTTANEEPAGNNAAHDL
jgi:hypothetical protein